MIRLYTPGVRVTFSFKGSKRETVPGQSLSLREILRRFVRRESLPVSVNDGVFEHRFGDLEKMSKGDIFDQTEQAKQWRDDVRSFEAREQAKAEAAAKAAATPPVVPKVKAPKPKVTEQTAQ